MHNPAPHYVRPIGRAYTEQLETAGAPWEQFRDNLGELSNATTAVVKKCLEVCRPNDNLASGRRVQHNRHNQQQLSGWSRIRAAPAPLCESSRNWHCTHNRTLRHHRSRRHWLADRPRATTRLKHSCVSGMVFLAMKSHGPWSYHPRPAHQWGCCHSCPRC